MSAKPISWIDKYMPVIILIVAVFFVFHDAVNSTLLMILAKLWDLSNKLKGVG